MQMYTSNDLKRPLDRFDNTDSRQRTAYGPHTATDIGRIIHSPTFRRLQGKMQLFPLGESETLRTRLTHSLEVAEIASRIAITLNSREDSDGYRIDPSIVTAAALAHDIVHPPFGHTGELALDECVRELGGFEGNAQTLRLITTLECRLSPTLPINPTRVDDYPPGLNLLYRTMMSVIKYKTWKSHQSAKTASSPRDIIQQKKI